MSWRSSSDGFADVPTSRVPDVIFGYTVANDVTARDLQRTDGQWSRAKGYDTFCPLGPWITTHQSVEEVSDLRIRTTLDGELKQDGRTRDMVFGAGKWSPTSARSPPCCPET